MPFKEGTEVEHVHAFRGLINAAKDLDLRIDNEELTPHEAMAELQKVFATFPPEPRAKKKVA